MFGEGYNESWKERYVSQSSTNDAADRGFSGVVPFWNEPHNMHLQATCLDSICAPPTNEDPT